MSYVRIGGGMISDEQTGEVMRWDREYPAHYCASALRARGWTDTMIRDMLGDADLSVVNPYFFKAGKARLWSRTVVEQVEAGAMFRTARAKAAERSAKARSRYSASVAHDRAA